MYLVRGRDDTLIQGLDGGSRMVHEVCWLRCGFPAEDCNRFLNVPNRSVSLDRDLDALVLLAGSFVLYYKFLSAHCLGPYLSMIDMIGGKWDYSTLTPASMRLINVSTRVVCEWHLT